MVNLQRIPILQRFLKGFILWISLGSQTIIISVTGLSSGSSYVLFQRPQYPRDCKEVLNSCGTTHNVSGVYIIKPDGYREPFEVYCDNDLETGGWTVLQRRSNGSVNFNRTWEDFKRGFGFLGSEFWMGNDRIAFLTNQKQYKLRLEFHNAAEESFYVNYDNFRISDEYGRYMLLSIRTYRGTAASYIEWCPANEIFSSQTCERTCDNPENCISGTSGADEEKCVCIGDFKILEGNCVPDDQCGCFVAEKGSVLQNGDSYVNSLCTRRSTCSYNHLTEEDSYRCSDDATCGERNGIRKCYCNNGYEGDGVTCTQLPKDCKEIYDDGRRIDDTYTIYPDGYPGGIQVYCEMERNGGGWTFIQRRSDASLSFYRVWSDYKNGFGNPSSDHWLGNKYIHAMTNQKTYKLRIDLRDSRSSSYYAVYSSFSISNEADKYRLSVGSYRGNTGHDSLGDSNNRQFSTRDRDNDGLSSYDCAERHRGAWWFYDYWHCRRYNSDCPSYCPSEENTCDHFLDGTDDCRTCANSHLNGDYDGSIRGTNIYWHDLSGYDCGIQ